MLIHQCQSSHDPHPVGTTTRGHKRSFTVDLHCHTLAPEVEKHVAGLPQKIAEQQAQARAEGVASSQYNAKTMLPAAVPRLLDLALRLKEMDDMGVDIQVLSPSPTQYYYWAEADLGTETVRIQNEHIAALCAKHPDRLAGLGTVALQHPELSIRQLEHCVKELGLKGVEISSTVNGLELADPKFTRFWAKAEELGCLVFLHPFGTSLGERLNQHYLYNVIGQPLETTIALSHLIFGGVLDRHPGLKICAAHGGGYLASYICRSDHAYRQRTDAQGMKQAPSEYLKKIYFDTVVYTPSALRHLIDQVGASQIVVGTDYPFDMGSYDVHALIDAVPGLSESDKAAILGNNAVRLLGLNRGRR